MGSLRGFALLDELSLREVRWGARRGHRLESLE